MDQTEDDAFLAEMMDGEPPVVEVEPEEKAEEPPARVEVIAGYTEDELKAVLDKAKETDAIRADLARVQKGLETANGTYGDKLARLQQSVAELSKSAEFSPEDFAELAAVLDLPEMTEAMVKGLNKKLKTARVDNSEIERIATERAKPVEEMVVNLERKLELKALSLAHPDWKDVSASKEFVSWAQSSLTPQDMHDLDASWDSDLVAKRLSEYKTFRDKQEKTTAANKTRLEAAIETRGIGGKQHPKSAIDEEEEAFRREMAS